MTTQADILGRKPVRKPTTEQDIWPDRNQDWRGEHLIRGAKVHRVGNKCTVANAMRKGMRKRGAMK